MRELEALVLRANVKPRTWKMCGHHDGLGNFDDEAKNGSIAMRYFCGYPS